MLLWYCEWFSHALEMSVTNKCCWFGFTWNSYRIWRAEVIKKTSVFHEKCVVHNICFLRRKMTHSGTVLTFMWLKVFLFFNKKFVLIYSNFLSLLFSECYFIIPSSNFPFASFCHRLFRCCSGRELSVGEHVYTYVVLIRMPLTPLGPVGVWVFLPLRLSLTSCFHYYSWCRTGSHLFFWFCSVGGWLANKNVSSVPVDFTSFDDSISLSVLPGLILALSFSDDSAVVFRCTSIKSAVTLNDTGQSHLAIAL